MEPNYENIVCFLYSHFIGNESNKNLIVWYENEIVDCNTAFDVPRIRFKVQHKM